MDRMLSGQKSECLKAYWAGNPWSASDMKSLQRVHSWVEDFFDSSAEDVSNMKEVMDEYERD